MTISEKLDIMLTRRNMRRVEFAEKVGITYRAFAYYMSGTRKPRKSVLERIAKELEVEPGFLLDDSVDIELNSEEKLIKRIADRGMDTTDAVKFLSKSRGLFAGNSLTDEDKMNLMSCLSEIYEDSKKHGRSTGSKK